MRTRDPAGKRAALLDAGLAVADEHGLGQLTVDRVVTTAGVAKGSFFHHFNDRATFLVELHRRFHDRITEDMLAAVRGMPPGRQRLLAGVTAYLDGCRRDRGTRALLIEARAEPAIRAERADRNEAAATLAAADFEAMAWPEPKASAWLWVVMAAEVAVAESDASAVRPRLRAALGDFLGTGRRA